MLTRGEAAFLVLVGTAFIFAAGPALPEPPLPDFMKCNHGSEPANDYCRALSVVAFAFHRFVDYVEHRDKLFVALGTAAIAWFTFTLWQSTKALWLQNENNFTRLERAYIFTGPQEIEHDPAPGFVRLRLTASNFGRTLGIIQEVHAELLLAAPSSAVAVYSAQDVHTYDLVVMPGQRDLELFDDYSGTGFHVPFIVAGYVRYLDVARNQHTSRFCLEATGGVMRPVGHRAWNEWD